LEELPAKFAKVREKDQPDNLSTEGTEKHGKGSTKKTIRDNVSSKSRACFSVFRIPSVFFRAFRGQKELAAEHGVRGEAAMERGRVGRRFRS
jgi:hypothetical protein